ncbi:hypothetical protein Q1695_014080 [Nippostrongylus brasiliensis]|nr:hypothetical protein Q1695_014080 [Nippostrongylus brasiliensis]
MQLLRRIRTSVVAISPRAFLATTVRLLLATVVNFYFSQLLFDVRVLASLDKVFSASPMIKWRAFRAESERLPKMQRLWPPHSQIELTAIFTTTLYLLLEHFLNAENVCALLQTVCYRTKSSLNRRHSPQLSDRLLAAILTAFAMFLLLLPMQRLAEMHILVIVMNLLHSFVTCVMTAVIMFAFTQSLGKERAKAE